jgi:hypothetical protein
LNGLKSRLILEREGVNDLKKIFSGMLLMAGLSVFILGGCYDKPAEAPKAPAEAPKAAAPAEVAPTSAPAAAAPTSAPAAAPAAAK